MLLRKHLTGAKILEITQPPGERVLFLRLETSDAMGIRDEKQLIVEMIGRMSSVILKGSDGIIIDCHRRIGGELTGKRSLLPGLIYREPPAQEGKLNPLDITDAKLSELIKAAKVNKSNETVEKWLISAFTAFSPLICREIVWRAYGDTDYRINAINDDDTKLKQSFFELTRQVSSGDFEPWLISSENNKPQDFSYTQIRQYESIFEAEQKKSFSGLLDCFFTQSAQEKRNKQRSSVILKIMTNARERLIRKLEAQRIELEETSKRDYFRECGDLITAGIYKIEKGQSVLSAEDFFSESEKTREIKLDPLKTPQQNAAKYYKAYKKAKNAGKFLTMQTEAGEKELKYVGSVIEMISRADNESELNEIRDELITTGYIRQKPDKLYKHKKGKKQKIKSTETSFLRFRSTSGLPIFAGKNNIQNDKLTLKVSSKTDIWFHAQKIHGSHIVVSGSGASLDDETLTQAASIAAYYSAARKDGKVPVDYTPVKNVKKLSGGRPGMVIYTGFKTIITTPDEELVKRLRED